MKRNLYAGTMLGLMVVLALGCGSDLDTAKVNGKVTVGGQPVEGITVTFMPAAGGRPAQGITDASGNFSLSTMGNEDGAVPGKHKVTFSKDTSTASSDSSTAALPKPVELPFNAKYSSVDTSGITAEVVAGKTNQLEPWNLEK
jgi:hypothetical protein